MWFVQGDTFTEWKSSSQNSLLWVHGKRGCLIPLLVLLKTLTLR